MSAWTPAIRDDAELAGELRIEAGSELYTGPERAVTAASVAAATAVPTAAFMPGRTLGAVAGAGAVLAAAELSGSLIVSS